MSGRSDRGHDPGARLELVLERRAAKVLGGERMELRIADRVQNRDRIGDGIRIDGRGSGVQVVAEAGQYPGHRFHGGDDLGMSRRAGERRAGRGQNALRRRRFGDGIQERTTG